MNAAIAGVKSHPSEVKFSFFWKVVLPVPILFPFLIVFLFFYLAASTKNVSIELARADSINTVNELKSLRKFFSSDVSPI